MYPLTARLTVAKSQLVSVKHIDWVNVRGELTKTHHSDKVTLIYSCLNKRRINDEERVKEGEEMYCDIL